MISARRTMLAVLSAWHGLAAFKNVCDLAAEFNIVPDAAAWRSDNFAAMAKLLAPVRLPREVLGVLLAGAAAVEAAVALGFACGKTKVAFPLAFALFGTFAVVDEAFRDYKLDETHREILTFLMLAWVVTDTPS